ncbi:unnamed protein product, partial [Closterium sp. NIES-64]
MVGYRDAAFGTWIVNRNGSATGVLQSPTWHFSSSVDLKPEDFSWHVAWTLFLKLCAFVWAHLSPYITPALEPFLPAWQQQWATVQAVLMDPCSQHALMADTHLLFLLLVALASLVRALQPAPRLGPGVTPEQLQQQHWLHHRRHVRVLEGSLYTVTVVLTMLVGLANLVVSLWYVWPGWRPEWSDCPIFEDLLPIVQCVAWFGMSWSVMEEKRQGATWHFFTLRLWWTSVFVLNSWSVVYSLVQMHKGVPLSVDAALGIIAWPISAFLFAVACQKPPPVHRPNEPLTESLLSGLPGVADQPTDPGVTPWERAGWWNVLTFQWINPLLAKGHQKPLDLPDIPFLADWDTADAAREAFYRTWDRIRLYTPLQQPSITWTLWLTYWRKFLAIAFWAGLETLLLYIGPSLLAEFVRVVGGDVPVLTFDRGGAAGVCAAGVAGDAGAGGGSCSSSSGSWHVDLAGPLAALGTSLTGAFGLTGLFGSAASATASAATANLTATAQTIASATAATAAAAASSAAAFVTQTAANAAAAATDPAAAAAAAAASVAAAASIAAAAPAPSPGAPPDDPWAQWEGYWLCGVLLGCKLIETVAQHQFYFRSDILGMNVRAALTGHVFDKALRLSNAARHTHPMGEIVNYMALDVQVRGWVQGLGFLGFVFGYSCVLVWGAARDAAGVQAGGDGGSAPVLLPLGHSGHECQSGAHRDVLDKALRLSNAARHTHPMGEIVKTCSSGHDVSTEQPVDAAPSDRARAAVAAAAWAPQARWQAWQP